MSGLLSGDRSSTRPLLQMSGLLEMSGLLQKTAHLDQVEETAHLDLVAMSASRLSR